MTDEIQNKYKEVTNKEAESTRMIYVVMHLIWRYLCSSWKLNIAIYDHV
jgi:hypothetical protein